MRIFKTKNNSWLADDLESLKQYWLHNSKLYDHEFMVKINTTNSRIEKVENIMKHNLELAYQCDERRLKATTTMLVKNYPFDPKYPYEFEFDLPINFAVLRYYRRVKNRYYFIFSYGNEKRTIRLGYEGILENNVMKCTCLSGIDFNLRNKVKGLDFNFIKPTHKVPITYSTSSLKIYTLLGSSVRTYDNPKTWIVNSKYIVKYQKFMMEYEYKNKNKPKAEEVD